MSWVVVGVTAASMVAGGVQADQKDKAQTRRNKAFAEGNRYSNWTGRRDNLDFSAPTAMDGALQGGAGGLALGTNLSRGSGGQTGGISSQETANVASGVTNPGTVSPGMGGYYSSLYQPSRGRTIYNP